MASAHVFLRESGGYALVDGTWWRSSRPLNGRDAVLIQRVDGEPSANFRPGSSPGVYTRSVAPSRITSFIKVVVIVDVDGIGPFTVTSVRAQQADVTYGGVGRRVAAGLAGLRVGDAHVDGADIFGTVDLSRLSNIREEVTPIEVLS